MFSDNYKNVDIILNIVFEMCFQRTVSVDIKFRIKAGVVAGFHTTDSI